MPVLSLTRMNTPWTTTELQLLRERYPYDDLNVLAHELGRTKTAIMYQASMLNVKRADTSRRGAKYFPWTNEEYEYLRKHYPTGDIAEIAAHMGRSEASVMMAAHKLRIKRKVRAKAVRPQSFPAKKAAQPIAPAPAPAPAPRPVIRPETVTEQQHALRKRRMREVVEAMVEHGVDEVAAELAAGLIVRGRVPGVRFEA